MSINFSEAKCQYQFPNLNQRKHAEWRNFFPKPVMCLEL